MKKITLIALTIVILLCVVGQTSAYTVRWPVMGGRLLWDPYPMCICPDCCGCLCIAFSRSHGQPLDLTMLDSFEGEDGEYLYFSATIREDTDPPIFDFTVAGDAKVKISKKQLQQYLMEEE
ncbi:MAG: hypothetical protein ACUVUU_09570 [bacterium]